MWIEGDKKKKKGEGKGKFCSIFFKFVAVCLLLRKVGTNKRKIRKKNGWKMSETMLETGKGSSFY